jgi:hypothetical protein
LSETAAPDRLRRKADEYRALGEEHATPGNRVYYQLVELLLRELADALDDEPCREAA